jgi:hypothetical protein
MDRQIAARFPDEAPSVADAKSDAQIYSAMRACDDEFAGLAGYAAQVLMDELD